MLVGGVGKDSDDSNSTVLLFDMGLITRQNKSLSLPVAEA